jgi:hypothetical protein
MRWVLPIGDKGGQSMAPSGLSKIKRVPAGIKLRAALGGFE